MFCREVGKQVWFAGSLRSGLPSLPDDLRKRRGYPYRRCF